MAMRIDEKRAAAVLEAAAELTDHPGHDALRGLTPLLTDLAAELDPADVAALRTAPEPRAILAGHPSGPVVALRYYAPGERSTVHSHAWTVLYGLEGSGSLQRWADSDGGARLSDVVPTSPGRAAPIDGDECHRQVASREGCLELVVIGDYQPGAPRAEYEPAPGQLQHADLFEAFIDAWSHADAAALAPLFADDVFADVHVPRWRVQLRGRDKVVSFIDHEEFQPDFRLTQWSARPTADGFVVEVESNFDHGGKLGMAQMVLLLRARDGRITEQGVYCTGIWDQATIDGLAASGGLLRP
jgi:hypothetical protein